MEAGNYIQTIENRQGLKICCPEEIAFVNGWIDREQLARLAAPLSKVGYGQYLLRLAEQDEQA
jgi:glucose-1-phosphate thymidylyltransferase